MSEEAATAATVIETSSIGTECMWHVGGASGYSSAAETTGRRTAPSTIKQKKREGFAVLYGTDLLLEPYRFALLKTFYNVNHKN